MSPVMNAMAGLRYDRIIAAHERGLLDAVVLLEYAKRDEVFSAKLKKLGIPDKGDQQHGST